MSNILRIAIVVGFLLLLVEVGSAATLTVNASGGAMYTRIQEAVNASNNGDTILVYSGTYFENINVTKQLTLHGVDTGSGKPMVDADKLGSAVTLSAGLSELDGFTAANSSSIYPNAGILVNSNNNIIKNNTASSSFYGIRLDFSSNNTISGNTASNNNYGIGNQPFGIVLSNSNNNTITINTVSNNGGGIFLYYSNNNTLKNNTVTASNNPSSDYALGIFIASSSKNILSDNIMTGNKYNFRLDGTTDSAFDNQVDSSNLVNGRPIYYIKGVENTVYGSSTNAGTFYCIRCINVTLKDINLDETNDKGIYFWKTNNSRIQNVNTLNSKFGIFLYYSDNNTLNGNNASNNSYGIYMVFSNNNTLSGNTALNNRGGSESGYGIFITNSNDNTLNSNNASNNYGGLVMYLSNNNSLIGNNISNNIDLMQTPPRIGIELSGSTNNTLRNNHMSGNTRDVKFSRHYNDIDTSNIVNGKPIYYLIGATDAILDISSNAGTIYCISCNNITIKNLNFTKNGYGIYLFNTNNSQILNNQLKGNSIGIELSYSNNNTLSNNIVSENNYGIELMASSYNKLNNNSVNSSTYGLFSSRTDYTNKYNNSNNILNNNTLSSNYYGINFIGDNNTISNNTVSLNNNGISIAGDNYIIFNNIVSLNNYEGIYIYSQLVKNGNLIYNNYFNNYQNFNYDSFNKTKWNSTKIADKNIVGGPILGGNFWANPTGTGFSQTCTDANQDGICDSIYPLNANSTDYLPLAAMPAGYGYISGNVLNGTGVTCAIVSTNTNNITITDSFGLYSLLVPAGAYNLTVTKKPEYYSNSSVVVTAISGTTIMQDIEILKKQIGTISGTVTSV